MPAVLRTMGLAENTLPSRELAAFENWGQACLCEADCNLRYSMRSLVGEVLVLRPFRTDVIFAR